MITDERPGTKRCGKCGQVKDVQEFARDRGKACGRKSLCKACDRAKARRYYAAHRKQVPRNREEIPK